MENIYRLINTKINKKYQEIDKEVQKKMLKHKTLLKWIALLIVLLTPIFFAQKNLDSDTWFLLNSGRYILKNGFTRIEPFSMHQGLAFSFQQWLTDIYFYFVYNWGEEKALILVIMLESIVMLVLYYWLCLLVSEHNTGQSLIATILFSAIASIFMVTRPQITTYIILITELLALEIYVRKQNKHILYILPLLSILEINFHAATWWFLFVFLLPYLCELKCIKGKRLKADCYPKKDLWIIACLMFGCGFLNPYGITNILYLFRSNGSKYISYISEMRPTTYNSINFFLMAAVTVVILVHLLRGNGIIKLRYTYFYLGCMLLAFVNMRNCVLFAMVGFVICAYTFRKVCVTQFKITYFILYGEILLGTFIFAAKFEPTKVSYDCQKENEAIIEYLNTKCVPEETKLYTEYNTGAIYGYAGYRCFIDARMEVYTKKMNRVNNYFDEAVEVENGFLYYGDFFEKYKFNYYILQKDRILYINFIHDNRYEKVYETKGYALFKERV